MSTGRARACVIRGPTRFLGCCLGAVMKCVGEARHDRATIPCHAPSYYFVVIILALTSFIFVSQFNRKLQPSFDRPNVEDSPVRICSESSIVFARVIWISVTRYATKACFHCRVLLTAFPCPCYQFSSRCHSAQSSTSRRTLVIVDY